MPDNQETDTDRLQDIMESLPDSSNYPNTERREYSLTKGDVLLIYRIARIANHPHVCPFEGEEQEILVVVAKSINKTQKVASVVIISGVVTGILAGVWVAFRHILLEFTRTGGIK